MKKYTVTFLPDERIIKVDSGKTIAQAAQSAEIFINNLCGGEGVCGECRVRLVKGSARTVQRSLRFFSQEEIDAGFVLACQAEITEDLSVEIPPESRIEGQQILTDRDAERLTKTVDTPIYPFKPLVRKIFLELPEPTLDDNITDVERISRLLRQRIGWHSYDITLTCLQKVPSTLRGHDWKVTASLVKNKNAYRIHNVEPLDRSNCNYGLAIDVGTTTVVVQLVDLKTGEVLGVDASLNKQAQYGEDVISRMIYACGKGGLSPLHDAIVRNINGLIENVVKKNDIELEDVTAIVAAGNTTMSHFLLNLTPCSIRIEPYVPATDIYPQVMAHDIGIHIHPEGILETIPSVASYVGGDIVAGVVACGIADHPEVRGLIDIGTNGEIAIGNNEWLVCCSASAGPAFEGGGTRCGMRATRGAIEKVEIRDGKLGYQTIGNASPLGICGSGLIDAIYELVKEGIIGSDGRFDRERSDERLTFEDNIAHYVIARSDETETGNAIVITGPDVGNLIKSKGAVFAAMKCLTDYIGLPLDQLETLYVAGGFGNYLNIPKAIGIGLLPDIPQSRIKFVGNSSLAGARMALLSEEAFEKCMNISRSMTNIELSTYQPFMDEFIAALFLPHTDRKLFPSIKY
jgi:uncharacterized 2Fe-2S/4Fe-4S cluster protein (DUF4445 family)